MEFIKIYEARSTQEARMIIGAMSEKGISAEKKDMANAESMDIYAGGSLCAQEIFVLEEDRDKAIAVCESLSLTATL